MSNRMSVTQDEVEELCRLAAREGAQVMQEGMMAFYAPLVKAAQEWAENPSSTPWEFGTDEGDLARRNLLEAISAFAAGSAVPTHPNPEEQK